MFYIYYKAKIYYTYLVKQTKCGAFNQKPTLIKIYTGKYNVKIYKEYSVPIHGKFYNVIILDNDYDLLKNLDPKKFIMHAGIMNDKSNDIIDITKDINKTILYNYPEIKDMIRNIFDISECVFIIDFEFNEINF
jgi:hypothetical protein